MRDFLEIIWQEHRGKLLALWSVATLVLTVGGALKVGANAGDEALALHGRCNRTLNTYLRAGASATPEMWAEYEAAYREYRAKVPGLMAEMAESAVTVTMEIETKALSAGLKAAK